VSPVARSNGGSDKTFVAGTGSASRQIPAVAACTTVSSVVEMNESPYSGLFILLEGSLVVLLLMIGAWAVRKG
jgi:hypothetical protein